ncbi:MAG: hypothetical protein JXC32_10305 [Anaerolineae bacterium]|nr:hypothetical protein [Anaerolineae bacterium]
MHRRFAVTLVLLAMLALVAGPVSAQASLTIKPTQFMLSGVQGQTFTRTLLIQSTTGLQNLQLIVSDLSNDRGNVLVPTLGPDATALPTDLADDAVLGIPVTFNLGSVPAGTYVGELLITYQGGSQIVPMQVAVKAQPWLPLVALVGGVALGVGVSSYRAKGRPRDEVMVRLGQIRTQMKVDGELHSLGEAFLNRIQAKLVDVEAALEAQQWEKAESAAEEAATIWTRWRRYRPDWIVQLTAYQEFVKWLSTMAPDSRYVAELQQAATDHLRATPDLEGPLVFRTQLEPLRDKANAFVSLLEKIRIMEAMGATGVAQAATYRQQLESKSPLADDIAEQLASLRQRVTATLAKLRKTELNALLAALRDLVDDANDRMVADYQTQIDALPPEADSAYLELRTDLLAALEAAQPAGLEELEPEGAKGRRVRMGLPASSVAAAGPSTLKLMNVLPEVRVQTLEEGALGARRRLRWFIWLTYAITVTLLALAGFVELYGARADFGANGVADFFTLLAWGFGAEATRSAIAEMVQSWGIVRQ